MKRIALLGFIIFVVPILVVSFLSCNDGGSIGKWTWVDFKINATDTLGGFALAKRDTIKTDSVYFKCEMISKNISFKENGVFSIYSALATPPSDPEQTNLIRNIIFAIGSPSSIDTSINSTLVLKYIEEYYKWSKNKNNFIYNIRTTYHSGYDTFKGKFINPHNSKPTQIIMMAIKENGDTLKAVSQEIFLK